MDKKRAEAMRGSALVLVIMFTLAVSMIAASVLHWALTERRLNERHALRLESRNAAEAVAEYGFAQVRYRMENQTSFPDNALNPAGLTPLVKPPASWYTGSRITNSSIELVGGIANVITDPDSNMYYVDPADPNNAFDPLKGKLIFRKDVEILAKATVQGKGLTPITSYVVETLAMREAPLFAHALFYNMDLELAPGADFRIIGSVHTNGDLWVVGQADNGSQTDFLGKVTIAGGLYWGYKKRPIMGNGSREPLTNEDIRFLGKNGSLINLRVSGVWRDHTMGTGSENATTQSAFRSFASNTYGGNLQTALHGVENYKPVAFGDYEPDPSPNNGVDNSQNTGRAMIERPLASGNLGFISDDNEGQKLSRRAGLYITVNPTSAAAVGKMPNGTSIIVPANTYRAFNKDGTEVYLPGSPSHSTPGGRPVIQLKPAQMTDMRRFTNFRYENNRSNSNRYDPKVIDIIEFDLTAFKMAIDRTVNGRNQSTIYDYDSSSSDSTYRSNSPSTVNINSKNQINNFTSGDWNGAVYIESINAETRKDSGVRLINGRGPVASTPVGSANEGLTIATNDALYILGHLNADGQINTNANSLSDSSRYPESNNEVPMAVAADAITILSQPEFSGSNQVGGWNDALSDLRHTSSNYSSNWDRTNPSNSNYREGNSNSRRVGRYPTDASPGSSGSNYSTKLSGRDTEIAAALLTGIVPTDKDGTGQYSGGAHNFPRLLESWSERLIIRGSMVALFESRVATEPWGIRYYNAPGRYWGYNEMYSTGRYPPQTPMVRTYRRVDFRDLSPTEYATKRSALPW